MSTSYAYQVKDPLGKVHVGTIEAASVEEATMLLTHDGFRVLEIDEADGEEMSLIPRRVTKKEIIYMTSQLAIMVDTGITLSEALRGIGEQEENPTLRKLLLDLKQRVEGGDDFSTALSVYPRYFDKTFVALIRASEQTGSLGEMLDRIANYMQKEADMVAKVRASMAYPAVMASVAVGVTIFLLTYVLPKFMPLFTKKGMQLPTPTKILIAISDALVGYWYLWLIGLVLLIIAFFWGKRTEPGRQVFDWIRIHAPIIGPLCRRVTLSRSIRTLGAMVKSGVSMIDALTLCSQVSGNYHYEQLWLGVLDSVTQGNRICEALTGNKLIPPTLIQMIGAGEETGQLDVVLEKVSDRYDQEVELSIKTATSLIEPIMITVMGVVVGGIGMSLMLPIFSLSRGH